MADTEPDEHFVARDYCPRSDSGTDSNVDNSDELKHEHEADPVMNSEPKEVIGNITNKLTDDDYVELNNVSPGRLEEMFISVMNNPMQAFDQFRDAIGRGNATDLLRNVSKLPNLMDKVPDVIDRLDKTKISKLLSDFIKGPQLMTMWFSLVKGNPKKKDLYSMITKRSDDTLDMLERLWPMIKNTIDDECLEQYESQMGHGSTTKLLDIQKHKHNETIQNILGNLNNNHILSLFNIETEKVGETMVQMIQTVLDNNDTLVMINELQALFERERVIKRYLMTGKGEYLSKSLYYVDQDPALLAKVSDDIVRMNQYLDDSVSYRKHHLEKAVKQLTRLIDSNKTMKHFRQTPRDGECGATLLSTLLGTDAEVLEHMMTTVQKKNEGQSDILRGIQTLKLKMLLDKDTKLFQRLQSVFRVDLRKTMALNATMKAQWKRINGIFPVRVDDVDSCIRVARSPNILGKIYDFVENRNAMLELHSQLQNGGRRETTRSIKYEDISTEITEAQTLIRSLKGDTLEMMRYDMEKGNAATVRRFIDAGIDLEYSDHQGNNILVKAGECGQDEMFNMLVERCGKSVIEAMDREGCTPLHVASIHGQNSIVTSLMKAGASVENEAIALAIHHHHTDVVRTLVKYKKDVCLDDNILLEEALYHGQYDAVALLIDSDLAISVQGQTLQENLVKAVKGGEGNGGAIALLLTEMIPSSSNMNLDYFSTVAKHGDVVLYRQLVLRCKPQYSELFRLPYQTHLPYFPLADYNIHSTVTLRHVNSELELNEHFQDIKEVTTFPGYGDVKVLQVPSFLEVSQYCDKVVHESINYENIEKEEVQFSYRRCGSSAEGTKVALPDEFDYFLRCHVDIDYLDIMDVGYGYKLINETKRPFQVNTMIDDVALFSINLISRGSKEFHDHFHESFISKERHDDKILSSQDWTRGGGTASTEWKIRYKFDDDHSLDISVDLVPVIHIDGWPSDARNDTWLMDKKELQGEGYAFVAKPPSRKSKFGRQFTDDVQQTMWRISFGHLEARHLAELDQRTKDVYITCKTLRDPDISHVMFKDLNGKPLSISGDLITSYWLKMVFMFNVPEFLLNKRSLVEMVYIVYSQVAKCISRWWLPFYWQPHINVLEGLSQDPKQCKQAARVMKQLVTGWYMRDGQSDMVEEEEMKTGGIYPHLPKPVNKGTRANGGNDDEDESHDSKLAGGCPKDSHDSSRLKVGGPENGERVGDSEVSGKVGGTDVSGRVGGPDNRDRVGGPDVSGRVGGAKNCDRVGGADVSGRVGGLDNRNRIGRHHSDALDGSGVEGHDDGSEEGGAMGSVEEDDSDESEDEFVVVTYSRTPNIFRDPGYNLYQV